MVFAGPSCIDRVRNLVICFPACLAFAIPFEKESQIIGEAFDVINSLTCNVKSASCKEYTMGGLFCLIFCFLNLFLYMRFY